MLLRLATAWTLISLSAFILQCLAAPTSQDGDHSAQSPPQLVRIKRADEIIFNGHEPSSAGEASLVKKSYDAAATGVDDSPAAIPHDVALTTDTKEEEPATIMKGVEVSATSDDKKIAVGESSAENDARQSAEDDGTDTDVLQLEPDAPSSDEREKRAAGRRDSELMLAENMAAAPHERDQKLRAKRDLNADEIRELFESPSDDYYTPDYAYDDTRSYNDFERADNNDDDDYSDESAVDDPWTYNDYYEDVYDPGRPKRVDDDQFEDDVEREAVRELLAERAAEEARQALLAYLAGGEPSHVERGPQYLVDPSADEEYEELDNGEEAALDYGDVYDEEPEIVEKRYPYSYEPYGGRWGALVPGAKRGDRDPYDRLYRLAEVLSRPPNLANDVNDYKK